MAHKNFPFFLIYIFLFASTENSICMMAPKKDTITTGVNTQQTYPPFVLPDRVDCQEIAKENYIEQYQNEIFNRLKKSASDDDKQNIIALMVEAYFHTCEDENINADKDKFYTQIRIQISRVEKSRGLQERYTTQSEHQPLMNMFTETKDAADRIVANDLKNRKMFLKKTKKENDRNIKKQSEQQPFNQIKEMAKDTASQVGTMCLAKEAALFIGKGITSRWEITAQKKEIEELKKEITEDKKYTEKILRNVDRLVNGAPPRKKLTPEEFLTKLRTHL